MAIPAIPVLWSTLVGAITAGIVGAMTSRIGKILAAMGLSYVAITGLQTLIGFFVADLNTAISAYNAIAGGISGTGSRGFGAQMRKMAAGLICVTGSSGICTKMLKMAAYIWLFDALNITLSAATASLAVRELSVMVKAMRG